MTSRFSGSEINTNELRAELIYSAESGDKQSASLLREMARRSESTAGALVEYYLERCATSAMETTLAGMALLCFGLVFGALGLVCTGFVVADLETLVILVAAFVAGQACLSTYNSATTAKFYAQQFQKLASMQKMNQLVKQQYRPVTSLNYAYSA